MWYTTPRLLNVRSSVNMEKKNHLFKAEIKEMLDLVVNSLYSKK